MANLMKTKESNYVNVLQKRKTRNSNRMKVQKKKVTKTNFELIMAVIKIVRDVKVEFRLN